MSDELREEVKSLTHSQPTGSYPEPIRSLSLGELVDLLLTHAAGEASEGYLAQILPLTNQDPRTFVRMLMQEAERRVDEIDRRYRSELSGPADATKVPPNGSTGNEGGSDFPGAEGSRNSPSAREMSQADALRRERDFYKALAEAYREAGIAALAGYLKRTGQANNMTLAQMNAMGVFDATRIRVEAEHASKPADSFAACWSPPGWTDPNNGD